MNLRKEKEMFQLKILYANQHRCIKKTHNAQQISQLTFWKIFFNQPEPFRQRFTKEDRIWLHYGVALLAARYLAGKDFPCYGVNNLEIIQKTSVKNDEIGSCTCHPLAIVLFAALRIHAVRGMNLERRLYSMKKLIWN